MTSAKGLALVTGASSGIGATYADRLAKRGYDLILVARNENRLASLAHRLRADSGRLVEAIVADLEDENDLARVEAVLRTDTRLTMLVNNAGVGATAPLLDADVAKMDAMIRLNVGALTRLTYAAAPGFVARGGGTIINIASIVAISPETLNGVYGGSKAFVLALSQSLHQELAGKGCARPGCPAWGDRNGVLGHRRSPTEQPAPWNRDVGGGPCRRRPRRPRPGRDRHHPIAARHR